MRLTEWKRGRRVGQNCTTLPPGQPSSPLKEQAPCTPKPLLPHHPATEMPASRGGRRKAPPGRVVSLTPAWGKYKVLGQGQGNFENQQIKIQRAHTWFPWLYNPRFGPLFLHEQNWDQCKSPELTAQVFGPREGGEGRMLDIPPRGRKLSKVRACQGQSEVAAACESCSPCLVHTSPPHPPLIATCLGPQGPHPSVARSRLGLWGWKGASPPPPPTLPCPKPVRGPWDEGGHMG